MKVLLLKGITAKRWKWLCQTRPGNSLWWQPSSLDLSCYSILSNKTKQMPLFFYLGFMSSFFRVLDPMVTWSIRLQQWTSGNDILAPVAGLKKIGFYWLLDKDIFWHVLIGNLKTGTFEMVGRTGETTLTEVTHQCPRWDLRKQIFLPFHSSSPSLSSPPCSSVLLMIWSWKLRESDELQCRVVNHREPPRPQLLQVSSRIFHHFWTMSMINYSFGACGDLIGFPKFW